jgi:hypothetical protein
MFVRAADSNPFFFHTGPAIAAAQPCHYNSYCNRDAAPDRRVDANTDTQSHGNADGFSDADECADPLAGRLYHRAR